MRNTSYLECPDLQEGIDNLANLSLGPATVQGLMWQEDQVSEAKSISKCLNKVFASAAAPSHDGRM